MGCFTRDGHLRILGRKKDVMTIHGYALYPAAFSLERLRLWACDNMAGYKIPGRFVLLERLSLNRSGKVGRIALKAGLDASGNARTVHAQ